MKIGRIEKVTLWVEVTVKCPRCGRNLKWPPRVQKIKCPCGAELRRK